MNNPEVHEIFSRYAETKGKRQEKDKEKMNLNCSLQTILNKDNDAKKKLKQAQRQFSWLKERKKMKNNSERVLQELKLKKSIEQQKLKNRVKRQKQELKQSIRQAVQKNQKSKKNLYFELAQWKKFQQNKRVRNERISQQIFNIFKERDSKRKQYMNQRLKKQKSKNFHLNYTCKIKQEEEKLKLSKKQISILEYQTAQKAYNLRNKEKRLQKLSNKINSFKQTVNSFGTEISSERARDIILNNRFNDDNQG